MHSVSNQTMIYQERKEPTKEVVIKSYEDISKTILKNGKEAEEKARAIHDKRPSFQKK